MAEQDAVALYESLARFGWWRSRRGVALPELRGLEIRKRLLPPDAADRPADGSEGLDDWLRELVGGFDGRRVLDLGCGFGATVFRAIEAGAAQAVGITPSPYQVDRARAVAGARGVDARGRFEVAAMHGVLPSADLVVAIESLGHTEQLDVVLENVATAIRGSERGRLIWLEDLLRTEPGEDPDVRGLAEAWCSPPLRSVASVDAALATAGLQVVREIDLTAQVPRREVEAIDRALRRLRRLLWITPVPFARRILQAFVGGLLLERLYARGRACYRLVMTEPTNGVPA